MRNILIVLVSLVILISCSSEEIPKELVVGDAAPDFAIKDLEGNVIILSYYKDQPVVLRFFETDCKFCRADTPIINVYFEKYKDKGLKVLYLAANHETNESVTRFVEDLDVPFPMILDKDAKIADLYNVLLYPQTIMLAPGMEVMAIIPGGVGEAELDEMVGPYLQDNNKVADNNNS